MKNLRPVNLPPTPVSKPRDVNKSRPPRRRHLTVVLRVR